MKPLKIAEKNRSILIFILVLGISCTNQLDYSGNCNNKKANWTAELEQKKINTLERMCDEEMRNDIAKEIEAQSCYLTANQMLKSMENMKKTTQCR